MSTETTNENVQNAVPETSTSSAPETSHETPSSSAKAIAIPAEEAKTDGETPAEDFAAVLEQFEAEQRTTTEAAPSEQNVIKGTLVSFTEKYAVVDIGNKSDGMVPIAEVMD